MKPKILLLPFLILLSLSVFSQDHNPFKSIGKKGKILTLSNGRYDEIFEKDSLERVGSVIVNRYTRKVEKFLDEDSLYKTTFTREQSRFLSVDPLASKFAELTPYQYASNRPIDGTDLDGLEWESSGKYFNSVTGKYYTNYKVSLSLNNDKNTLDLVQNKAKLNAIEKNAEQTLSKLDAKGTEDDPIISVDILFTKEDGPFKAAFFHAQTISRVDAQTGQLVMVRNETYAGKTDVIGNTQENFISIPLTNTFIVEQKGMRPLRSTTAPKDDKAIGRSFAHELGHTAGLRHPFDPQADENDVRNEQGLFPIGNPLTILMNLMNSPANPINALNSDKQGREQGTELAPDQRKKIEGTVQKQQLKKN